MPRIRFKHTLRLSDRLMYRAGDLIEARTVDLHAPVYRVVPTSSAEPELYLPGDHFAVLPDAIGETPIDYELSRIELLRRLRGNTLYGVWAAELREIFEVEQYDFAYGRMPILPSISNLQMRPMGVTADGQILIGYRLDVEISELGITLEECQEAGVHGTRAHMYDRSLCYFCSGPLEALPQPEPAGPATAAPES